MRRMITEETIALIVVTRTRFNITTHLNHPVGAVICRLRLNIESRVHCGYETNMMSSSWKMTSYDDIIIT
ncbi:hypothetical protein HanIR_Chr10g0480131 [Helianthus annuus]|nr:hypothetical protein HanIR_Chr10g0480131 [Helianthus annuus]